jgi:hypothetical protein
MLQYLRRPFLILTCLIVGNISLFSQSPPQGISYQAVARDELGNPIAETAISVRMSILANAIDGTLMWEEEHDVTSNLFGLFNLVIGQGASTGQGNSPSFELLNWGAATYFLQVELDPGDGIYELMGTSQLLSVPYALYAGSVADVDDADPDPQNELIESVTADGGILTITEAGTDHQVDLGDIGLDNDTSMTNECITLMQLNETSLNIVECGEAYVIDLGSLVDDEDWEQGDGTVFNTTDNIGVGGDDPQSTLQINGSVAYEVTQVGGPVTVVLDGNNHVVIADVTNGNVNLNLPPAATCLGRVYTIKIFSSGIANDLNLITEGSETVDGVDDVNISGATNKVVGIISDGSNWWVINGSVAP